MTSIEATEMMFKIREMLKDEDLNLYLAITSDKCASKMREVRTSFDAVLKEFTADEFGWVSE